MKNNQWLIVFFFLLLLLAGPGFALPIGIAATVDGVEITERKLQTAIDSHLKKQGGDIGAIRDPDKFKGIRDRILQVLIGQELLWQAAKRANIMPGEEAIDRALAEYKSQFRSDIDFQIKIQEGGYTPASFRENMRQQMSSKMWLEQQVLAGLAVGDAEVHEFYTTNQKEFVEGEKVRARHILIQLSGQSSQTDRDNAIARLAEIREQVRQGADFEVMAREHSGDSSADKGGDLGYFARGQMVKPFERAAFALKTPGELSEIVETVFGVHLIQFVDRQPASTIEEAQVRENIRAYLWQQKSREAIDSAVERLKREAVIEQQGQ